MPNFAAAKVDDPCPHKGCEERPRFYVTTDEGVWKVCQAHVWEGVQRILNSHQPGYVVKVERLP